ncbi:BnaCnng44280D [Brassica napus]|uniref:BnaCnng44280D protein n=1 Tax=Brassica napus TaxID=3708 RepID=A0A078JFV3_BRANA|nr:BnaCnng44280D [Brassica napus]
MTRSHLCLLSALSLRISRNFPSSSSSSYSPTKSPARFLISRD